MIRVADLNSWVELKGETDTPDGSGGFNTTPTTVARVPAKVIALSTTERIEAAATASAVSYTVLIRARAGVRPTMRLAWTPPYETTPKLLEIAGVAQYENDPNILRMDCGEAS